MKMTYFLTLCALVLSFSGCATTQPQEIVKEQVFVKQNIPDLPTLKPIQELQVFYIDVNGETFIAMKPKDGIILINNWSAYKTWAKENKVILDNLK